MTDTQQHSSLGQYRPLAQLGQGGMARVLLVTKQGPANIQKLLVVKEIREELANDAEFVTMFMDEARIATRMSHPNLVQTYDVAAEGQHYFMVMEYLEGQPMHAVLGRIKRKLSLGIHLRILNRVLAGLQYAHDLLGFDGKPLSVVHRDVSPQNTILCYDGQVKLVDFGIAKAAGAVSRTTAGMFKGKLGYVAPEQVAGGDIDRRADLYSVGVMLWEALVGRRLTYGENEAAILHKRTMGLHPRVLEAKPDADSQLAAICDRAMAHDPQKRFATAQEMLEALEARIDAMNIRVTDADIGALVSGAFAEERKGILAIVERQLTLPPRSAADASAVAKLPLLASETGPTSIPPPSMRRAIATEALPTITATSTSVDAPQFRPSKRKVAILAGVGLAVVFGVVVAVVAIGSSSHEQPKLGTVAPPTMNAETTGSVPTAPGTVDVAIEVTPPKAKIVIDGQTVGKSPFHGPMPRDANAHQLIVTADGFTTETRSFSLDRDVRLELSLHPTGNRVVFATPTAASASAAATTTAGTDLHVVRPKHNIDEKDPY